MIFLEDIMKRPVIYADPEESIASAAEKMRRHKIGSLPVLEHNTLVGIITSRDLRSAHPNRIVEDVMTKKVITANKKASVWRAFQLIQDQVIEHLPVMDEKNIIGIVSKADILSELGKHIDSLTGLYTSSFIHFIGQTLLNEGKELAILFFDLNDFGQYNKEWGHVAGDECLKLFGKLLAAEINPESDYICRYGGDEFTVITTRSRNEAIKWANHFIQKIETFFAARGTNLTVSVGIAGGKRRSPRLTDEETNLEALINLASLASTEAKKQGTAMLVVG